MLRTILAFLLLAPVVNAQQLSTVAESTKYERTSSSEEVDKFCEALAKAYPKTVTYTSYGTSQGGLKLPLLVISDAGDSPKPAVMAYANIHAGEVDGKEAVLAIARELAGEKGDAIRKALTVLIAPNVNPDGNDLFSADNRPEQNGPAKVGTRANLDKLDLNRDFVKLETAEIRALVRLFNDRDPLLVVDCHTTNGSHHRYKLTYDGPRYAAASPLLIQYSSDKLLPAIAESVKKKTGFDTFLYGNFNQDRTRWETYPSTPRFGTQYLAMRNRIGLLSESYSYASFPERITVTHAFVQSAFDFAAANLAEIQKLIADASRPRPKVTLQSAMIPVESPVVVLGYENDSKTPREFKLSYFGRSVSTLDVDRPAAYLIASRYREAVQTLQRHGIVVEEVREDTFTSYEGYRLTSISRNPQPFQKRNATSVEVHPETMKSALKAGHFLVRTDQPLGNLAAFLLEPQSEDGLLHWNSFDVGLKTGIGYPVLRLTRANLFAGSAPALPEVTKNPKSVTADVFYANQTFAGAPLGPVTWLPGGTHWLQSKGNVLMKVDSVTGESEPAYDSDAFRKSLATVQGLKNEEINALIRGARLRTDAHRTGTLVEADNQFWFAFFGGRKAVQLTKGPGTKEFVTLSPGGKRIAYVKAGNLYIADLETQSESKLTSDGGGDILNARGDWVYEEEIFNRNGQAYWWSPNGNAIAYLRFDDTPVKKFTITKPFPAAGETEIYGYPKPGDPNPTVSLHVVSIDGTKKSTLALGERSPKDTIICRVGWMPGGELYAYVQNRTQTVLDFMAWRSFDDPPKVLFTDRTQAWIDDPGEPKFLADGSFLFPSERDGWKHLYHYDASGNLIKQVTKGEWEVKEVLRVDEKADYVYFSSNYESPNGANLLRAKLSEGTFEALTKDVGTHSVSLAPAGDLYIDRYSDPTTPTRARLMRFDGKKERTLDSNPGNEREGFTFGNYERKQVAVEGAKLEVAITYPPKFDKTKKYPIWVLTYAGPHSPTIRDTFGSGRVFEQTLANMGIVVFRVDPRSASGKSAKDTWTCYRQLGVQELKDLESAVDWICANDWADKTRVGISGHSYGGFITCFALTHSKKFSAGIAGAPVTDWRLYDSIYTERYMGLPSENTKGYDQSSCVTAAKNLHGKLLIIHGLIDDNVHFQNAMQFADALQRANKPFEIMIYPRARHPIFGRHYQELQIDFIKKTMVK